MVRHSWRADAGDYGVKALEDGAHGRGLYAIGGGRTRREVVGVIPPAMFRCSRLYAFWNSSQSRSNCLIAERRVPVFRSRLPQSGSTASFCVPGLNHLL